LLEKDEFILQRIKSSLEVSVWKYVIIQFSVHEWHLAFLSCLKWNFIGGVFIRQRLHNKTLFW